MPDIDPEDTSFDPGIDILVGLVAVVLMITLTIIPMLRIGQQAMEPSPSFAHNGTTVYQLLAHAEGLTLIDEPDLIILTWNDLTDEVALKAQLAAKSKNDQSLAIFIEPTGLETTFLLESQLAKLRFDVLRIYLEDGCRHIKTQLGVRSCIHRQAFK